MFYLESISKKTNVLYEIDKFLKALMESINRN